ncbi:MAG: PHP domain-containing protein [Bacillota bacterium]
MVADLHLHTTASDGNISAKETIDIAYQRGLDYISITDHDSVDSLEEALLYSKNTDIKVIPGIEINSDFLDTEVHVLGYFIDYKSKDLLNLLKTIKNSRIKRSEKMLKKLNEILNINLEMEDLTDLVEGEIITRAHIAALLNKKRIVKNNDEAFDKYIGSKAPAYVKRDYITPAEAVEVIKKAGGIPVLAHPGRIDYEGFSFEDLLDFNFEGIEVFYPAHSSLEEEKFLKESLKRKLLVTGGSDNHGPGKGHKNLIGKVRLPKRFLKGLINEEKS